MVRATPLEDNECHADVVLPLSVEEDRERQRYHAKRLADMAKWRERPEPKDETAADDIVASGPIAGGPEEPP